jgi:hypothetical protein
MLVDTCRAFEAPGHDVFVGVAAIAAGGVVRHDRDILAEQQMNYKIYKGDNSGGPIQTTHSKLNKLVL